MKLCVRMYLDRRTNSINFQGHGSKVKVTGPGFRILYHCEATSRTLLNFKVVKGQGHMVLLVFFCVHDAAATRGQYLALSKV